VKFEVNRTPWPIHFKLRIVIGIIVLQSVYFLVKFRFFIPELWDLNYYSVLFQHKYCINVPDHKTINSNNYVKFEVNGQRGSQFTV
jgi:hypothetical protein